MHIQKCFMEISLGRSQVLFLCSGLTSLSTSYNFSVISRWCVVATGGSIISAVSLNYHAPEPDMILHPITLS